ncbi:hypothetical protein AQUCO_01100263v1 [Aquilegia coerulea]|uniref:COP9 signalosome complex subunit 3 n=1 Tax=Aquilegia coerulea TaxID=218851 RepID=A0A2G5E6A4_AQUCA|nr:hypothetical protein AQUCO_01100263v1 [Aquilegia coerulea]PIA51304.1 hypothetical protein AQUCO_01100263v1 [Aquilegia coerulea]PIA51307.1 hypothetical protein AQUCO_01100263v1 [Aquilegia coerulea]
MDSMEELVSQIQRLSSNMNSEEEISRFHSILKQAEESLLRPQASQLAPFLEQLNPSTHSLGYLYILEAYTGAALSKEQATVLVPVVATFLESCTAEQIRLVPDKFVSVCKKFKDEVVSLRTPMRGIAPIRTAIRKLQSSPEQLTTLHPDFLLLCLLAKCYKSGLSLLQEDIFEIDQPKDLFLYCYYGGMICIGQKSFRKAMELLKAVVTAPMSSTNAIAVEAHKKYILVSLIYNGQFSTGLPKYMSAMGQRNLKNYCQPYYDLANSYSTDKISEVESAVTINREKFESDNNLGLVKQVVSSLSKRNIQRLTQTYLTLSLEDMANRVQLNTSKEAELHVLQMIQDGEIFATINQKDGMVSFHEDPEQYKTCEMIEHIDSSIQRIMALSKKLSAVDENVSCDPTYLAKAGRERHRYDFDDYDSVPQRFNM